MWEWLQSDLASWLTVGLAVMAVLFALRRPTHHTELNYPHLHFNSDGGPISLELELATYSHSPRLKAKAKLKIDGVGYPMRLEPIKAPTNFQFATLNTLQLRFIGQYVKSKTIPTTAFIDVKTRLSDGSRARLRTKVDLASDEIPSELKTDKEGSQTE